MKYTPQQLAWLLYDPANAAYAIIVRTVVAPIFLVHCADGILSGAQCATFWGYTGSFAGIAAGAISIFSGPRIDARKKKVFMVALFTIIGVLSTFFYIAVPYLNLGSLAPYTVIAISFIGIICYMGSNSFYDSLLINITSPAERDRISSTGYALGYAGSLLSFLCCMPLLMFQNGKYFYAGAFIIAAVWWMTGSLPLLCKVRENNANAAPAVQVNFKDTLRFIFTNKNILFFLIAYFLYIDGVGTIIMQATLIAKELKISDTSIMVTLLALQLIALPFSLFSGFLAQKFSAKTMIFAAIAAYITITIIVTVMSFIENIQIRQILFYSATVLIGTAQGGIQALSRSLFSRIIPEERAAELFAVYNLFGKFTTIVGPLLLIPLAVMLWNKAELGITLLFIPFTLGAWLLTKVKVVKPEK